MDTERENLVLVDDKFIRPSAVVSIEPALLGGCSVYLAIDNGSSKLHRIILSGMSPLEAARALGLASERIENPV